MPRFEVTWVIDTDEDTPEAAAHEALPFQRRPDGIATHFKVRDVATGIVTEVDLDEIDNPPSPSIG